MNLRTKIKRVRDVEPRYAKPGDSGFDLVAKRGHNYLARRNESCSNWIGI